MGRKNIYVLFAIIAAIMLLVWLFAYRPVYSGDFSQENTDWGGFGDFFWGLGTMLLTALNVSMVYKINAAIENSGHAKDKYSIQKEIIAEYKSLRDKCLIRINSDNFQVDSAYIAQLESFIRELRDYVNIFPFLKDDTKRLSMNILQERLRLIQDSSSLSEWRKKHKTEEWESFNCVLYSHSEWLLGYMTQDWYKTVNESLSPAL